MKTDVTTIRARLGILSFSRTAPSIPQIIVRCRPLSARRCDAPIREKSRLMTAGSFLTPSSSAPASPALSRSR